jgi:dinuclear metal center YbgI/SA1388 family protein
MTQIKNILRFFENWAPFSLAEDYDNVGLLVGKHEKEVTRVLVSLDATEEVVKEAREKGCQLLISHHPILFKGIKRLNGQNYVARSIETAIRDDIGLLAVHTNLDHIQTGVNHKLGQVLGLRNLRVLRPLKNKLQKITVFVPAEQKEPLMQAMHQAGAGNIGNYSQCSFSTQGEGRFLPNDQANPVIGESGKAEKVEETRIEMILPAHSAGQVVQAMKKAHPYEEVAYFLSALENEWQEVGAGMLGELENPMPAAEYLQHIKTQLRVPVIRHTKGNGKPISRVAICGGSGFFLLQDAIAKGADLFLTADIKYHEFFDAESKILLADAGHFETEQFTSEWIMEKLSAQFPNIAVLLSETTTNPVSYA